MTELFLSKFIKTLFPTEATMSSELKNQSFIPFIFDALSRKEHHHVMLFSTFSETFHLTILNNIAQQLSEEHIPKALRESYFFFLDIAHLIASGTSTEHIEEAFHAFRKRISADNKRVILAINQIDPLLTEEKNTQQSCLGKLIKSVLLDEQWRLIVITDMANQETLQNQFQQRNLFSSLKLREPSTSDSLVILKTFRENLEMFHQVTIPDEAFSYSLSMATHYLGSHRSSLDKALQLLDSGAARASAIDRKDTTEQPILTNTILAAVVSNWTQIPLTYVQQPKFKASDYIHAMQNEIFGQEAAINITGVALQYSRMKLQNRHGPLCSFLFAGPANVGKASTAYSMAQQLFGYRGAVLRVNIDKTVKPTSLADIRVVALAEENLSTSLLDAIQQRPYAVVMIENINQAPPGTIDLFQDVFRQGYAIDKQGNKYDFRNAIVVVTTTLGAERIISLTKTNQADDATKATDLMQLVLNEHMRDASQQRQLLSAQELCEEILPALETQFSSKLLRHFNIVPFVLLDQTAVEKIIRIQLGLFVKKLQKNFGVELSYAPEVPRFLVQEILWRGESNKPINKALEQHLYSSVANELLTHLDDKSKQKKLLLQLNDTGQLLRCEFVSPTGTTLHQL